VNQLVKWRVNRVKTGVEVAFRMFRTHLSEMLAVHGGAVAVVFLIELALIGINHATPLLKELFGLSNGSG